MKGDALKQTTVAGHIIFLFPLALNQQAWHIEEIRPNFDVQTLPYFVFCLQLSGKLETFPGLIGHFGAP